MKKDFEMKHKILMIIGLGVGRAVVGVGVTFAAGQDELAQVRAATAQFHRTDAAKAAGYTLVPGLDYCFNNPGIGGMGVHLIKTSSLDTTVDVLQPQAMVYQPGANGGLEWVAVEYIVPAAAAGGAGE